VLFPADDVVSNRIVPVLRGSYTPEAALKVLLDQTDLRYQFVNSRTVAIRVAALSDEDGGRKSSAPTGASAESRSLKSGLVSEGASSGAQDDGSQKKTSEKGLATVTVTAEKRSERLQDVPVPVTAISADSLVDSNQLRLQDFYTRVPGLSFVPSEQG